MVLMDRQRHNISYSMPKQIADTICNSIFQAISCMLNDSRDLQDANEKIRIINSIETLVNFANELSHPKQLYYGSQEFIQRLTEVMFQSYNNRDTDKSKLILETMNNFYAKLQELETTTDDE